MVGNFKRGCSLYRDKLKLPSTMTVVLLKKPCLCWLYPRKRRLFLMYEIATLLTEGDFVEHVIWLWRYEKCVNVGWKLKWCLAESVHPFNLVRSYKCQCREISRGLLYQLYRWPFCGLWRLCLKKNQLIYHFICKSIDEYKSSVLSSNGTGILSNVMFPSEKNTIKVSEWSSQQMLR